MIYFTSDTHFGHTNIIKYCGRPFGSLLEMDREMIDNINKTVQPDDTLYHLGDFSLGKPENVYSYLQQINCRNIHWVKGNHDRLHTMEESRNRGLILRHYKNHFLDYKDCRFLLTHKPEGSWPLIQALSNYYHLHGHIHSVSISQENLKNGMMDVGVDNWGFRPISIEEIICHFTQ